MGFGGGGEGGGGKVTFVPATVLANEITCSSV